MSRVTWCPTLHWKVPPKYVTNLSASFFNFSSPWWLPIFFRKSSILQTARLESTDQFERTTHCSAITFNQISEIGGATVGILNHRTDQFNQDTNHSYVLNRCRFILIVDCWSECFRSWSIDLIRIERFGQVFHWNNLFRIFHRYWITL